MSAIFPFPSRVGAAVDPAAAVACVAEIERTIHLMRRQRSLERTIRSKLEDLVAQLIDIVDRLDGDPDLEDGGDAEGMTDDNGIGDEDGLWEQRRG